MAEDTTHDSRYRVIKFFDKETVEKLLSWVEDEYELFSGIATMMNPYGDIHGKQLKLKRLLKKNQEARIPSSKFLQQVNNNISLEWEIFTVPKGLSEIMYSVYDKGGYYRPHFDDNQSGHFSQTIFLSDPNTYEGGALQLWVNGEVKEFKLEPGYGVVYETGLPHCVTEVTYGTRKAFCFWTFSKISDMQDLYKYRSYQDQVYNLIPNYELGTPTYPINQEDVAKDLKDFVSKRKVTLINKAGDIVRKYI